MEIDGKIINSTSYHTDGTINSWVINEYSVNGKARRKITNSYKIKKERRVKMTTGSIMFYGGIVGVAIGILLALICMKVFPRQRKRLLEKLSKE